MSVPISQFIPPPQEVLILTNSLDDSYVGSCLRTTVLRHLSKFHFNFLSHVYLAHLVNPFNLFLTITHMFIDLRNNYKMINHNYISLQLQPADYLTLIRP